MRPTLLQVGKDITRSNRSEALEQANGNLFSIIQPHVNEKYYL